MLWPIKLDSIGRSHSKLLSHLHHALLTVSLLLHGMPSPDVDEVESDEECSKPKMQFSLLQSRGPAVGGITIQYPAHLYSQVLMPTAIQQSSSPIQSFLIRNPVFGQHSYIHSQYSIFQIHSKLRRNYAIE